MDNSHFFVAMYVLVLSLSLRIEEGMCQHYYLLRPIPSDSLPIVELKEDPDPIFDPKERDLNETELRSILGSNFDSHFMSITSPEDKYTGGDDQSDLELQQKPAGAMPREIKSMEFDIQHGKKHKPSKKLRRRLQLWLWSYAFCPVVYTWNDLGNRFWPRHVKMGTCYNKKVLFCSRRDGLQTCQIGPFYDLEMEVPAAKRRAEMRLDTSSVPHYIRMQMLLPELK